jgi:pimeloyl-ACP methyl ester carboxylesterase
MRRFLMITGYFLLGLLVVWLIVVQAGCLSMRTPDAEWEKKLYQKAPEVKPLFIDVVDQTGRRIHAVAVSSADTLPCLVWVHGSPGSSDAFLDYLSDSTLNTAFRMIAFDRPGFGYTEGFGKPEPSLRNQALALKAVADTFASGQKVLLAGHSLGASVIVKFAMDFPDLTAGLILLGGSVDPSMEEHPWWQKAVDKAPLKWFTPRALWTSNAEIIPLEKELEDILPGWEKITCPVMMIHARNDRLVPYANVDFARRMLVNCPDLRVNTFDKGDHFILWTRPDTVRKLILEMSPR